MKNPLSCEQAFYNAAGCELGTILIFLSSGASNFINGHIVYVDVGFLAAV